MRTPNELIVWASTVDTFGYVGMHVFFVPNLSTRRSGYTKCYEYEVRSSLFLDETSKFSFNFFSQPIMTMMRTMIITTIMIQRLFLSALLLLARNTCSFSEARSNPIVIRSIQDELPYDENGKLPGHFLVYPADPLSNCPWQTFQNHYGFLTVGLTGKAFHDVFPEFPSSSSERSTTCHAACLERGTDRSLVHAVMPHKYYNSSDTTTVGDFESWFKTACSKMEVCLINYYDKDHPLQSFWLPPNPGSSKVPHGEIDYGVANFVCFETYLGHRFQIEDSNGNVLEIISAEYSMVKAIGESPPSGDIGTRDIEVEINGGLQWEWKKHQRVSRTFSPLGFQKGRLPNDVFAAMGAYYYNNRLNKVKEEWTGKGLFVNWWESDVHLMPIPWIIKERWQLRLLHLVEAWAGVPVEQTTMYGLRQYNSGARLLTHVDRLNTHAVSMIVNIAQGNLTEPWPVEVFDHADRLHEVIMEPGDVVYYESAKNLHGRNRPMMGENAYYVNLFTHYRPVIVGDGEDDEDAIGDDLWYEKPNHDSAPEPLMEMKGGCRLTQVGVAETFRHTLGMVEAVECDDDRVGPFLSTTLFTASSGDDLMEWWRQTSPSIQNGDNQQCEE